MAVSKFTRVVAALQIAGSSAAALFLIATTLEQWPGILSLFIGIVMIAVCVAGFFGGIWLWNSEEVGYKLSIGIQAIQVPIIFSSVLSYKFIFGFSAYFVVAGAPIDVQIQIGSFSVLYLFPDQETSMYAINLFPIFVMSHLIKEIRQKRQVDDETVL